MIEQYSSDTRECQECMRKTQITQTKSFPMLPPVLIIHFSRFMYDNKLKKTSKIEKITPTPLELNCFCSTCSANSGASHIDHNYRLFGIICHIGQTIASGHYKTYARLINAHRNESGEMDCCPLRFKKLPLSVNLGDDDWYCCNDEEISVISETELQWIINRDDSEETPYLLFYVRHDFPR